MALEQTDRKKEILDLPLSNQPQSLKYLLSGPYQEKFFQTPRIKETNGRERTNPSQKEFQRFKWYKWETENHHWNTITVTTVLLLWPGCIDSLGQLDYVKGKIMILQSRKVCRYTVKQVIKVKLTSEYMFLFCALLERNRVT